MRLRLLLEDAHYAWNRCIGRTVARFERVNVGGTAGCTARERCAGASRPGKNGISRQDITRKIDIDESCARLGPSVSPRDWIKNIFDLIMTVEQYQNRYCSNGPKSAYRASKIAIYDPSRGANFQKIPIKADRPPRLIGDNSNRRHKQAGSTTAPRSGDGDRPQGDPGGARRAAPSNPSRGAIKTS
jgi:hypothetical protein